MAERMDAGEYDLVELESEDGEVFEFAFLGTLELEGRTFAVLAPADQVSDGGTENLDLYTFSYAEDKEGNGVFEAIEDDALAERVFQLAVQELSRTEE